VCESTLALFLWVKRALIHVCLTPGADPPEEGLDGAASFLTIPNDTLRNGGGPLRTLLIPGRIRLEGPTILA